MKIECPYCYQHYELEKSDMNREVVCINCEQTFQVRDALVLDQPSVRKKMIWVFAAMGVLIVLLIGLNLWNWQRLRSSRAEAPRLEANRMLPAETPTEKVPTDDAATLLAVQEMRDANARLDKRIAALEKSVAELTVRLAGLEKRNGTPPDTAALAQSKELEEKQKLLEEYHKQLLKGLTELRQEVQSLRIGERLSRLEGAVERKNR